MLVRHSERMQFAGGKSQSTRCLIALWAIVCFANADERCSSLRLTVQRSRRAARLWPPSRRVADSAAAWGLPFRHKRSPYGPVAESRLPCRNAPSSASLRLAPSPQGGKALSDPRLLLPIACRRVHVRNKAADSAAAWGQAALRIGLLLPIACCLLPAAYCLLPDAYCLMPIACCLLPIA